MTLTALSTLALIALPAVISPLLADLTCRVGIPDVVILLALGIVIGPEDLTTTVSGRCCRCCAMPARTRERSEHGSWP